MGLFDIDKLKANGKRFLDGFTTGQKVMTVLALVGLLVGARMFSSWESAPAMSPLFSNLDTADASEVTQALDAQGVAYELTDSGRTVMVSSADVYKVRIDLAGQGLPQGGDSFALLDDQSITTSEFKTRIDYQRALQGELGRTIMAMDDVDAAQVNLTLPRDDVFVGSDNPQARAAVLVRTRTGSTLASGQVDAIVHLVTASVPDLIADNVTVSDQSGAMLKALGSAQGGSVGSRDFEAQTAYENGLSSKIEQMLGRTLGPGAAVVAVSASMNFDKRQEEVTTPEAAGRDGECLVDQSQSSNERFEGGATTDQGVLGPNGTAAGTAGAGDTYVKRDVTTKCANGQTRTVTEQAPGQITRLSVSAQLDQNAIQNLDINQIEASIAAAAGIDETRGDTLSVTAVPMDTTAATEATAALDAAAKPQFAIADIIRYVVTLLIVALVLFFAWRAVKRSQTASLMRVPLDLTSIEASEARALPASASDTAAAQRDRDRERELASVAERVAELEAAPSPAQQEVVELIDRQPDEVAQTLRSWLADRRA